MANGATEPKGSAQAGGARADARSDTPGAGAPRPAILPVILGMMLTGTGAALSSPDPSWPGLLVVGIGALACAAGIRAMIRGCTVP